jgi:1-deoxy-D-xylulose-5-phosphate reductoisomerase
MSTSLALLGSTGSIGTQVLDVVRHFPERFSIEALAAGRNLSLLAKQVAEFKPRIIAIQEESDCNELKALLRQQAPDFNGEILYGPEGLVTLATLDSCPKIVVGLVGLIGLAPSLAALKAGKTLLTANKETFVAGGHLVEPYLSKVLPIDSEHSGVFQCLQTSAGIENISKLYLTASGGPFRNKTLTELASVTPKEALKHPKWEMGAKISVDSATLMNKGLEVIEAHWLFRAPYEKIVVVVHPESLIHGGIQFVDGSILLQMGATDMHGPIQYALTYPERLENPEPAVSLSFENLSRLTLENPDRERFPCLDLAYEAGRMGGGATAVLNGANEALVQLFLGNQLPFMAIPRLLEATLDRYRQETCLAKPSLEEVLELDAWARRFIDNQTRKQQKLPTAAGAA